MPRTRGALQPAAAQAVLFSTRPGALNPGGHVEEIKIIIVIVIIIEIIIIITIIIIIIIIIIHG